jgi:glyoxylase-like metal-dependent hydrolase (beta-lactamase superfamily II)
MDLGVRGRKGVVTICARGADTLAATQAGRDAVLPARCRKNMESSIMASRTLCLGALLLVTVCAGPAAVAADVAGLLPQPTAAYPDDLLERLRAAARAVPGTAATGLRYVAVAESRRPRRVVLDGGSDEIYVQARTVFQLAFADGTIMIDAGMDEDVHNGFSTGTPEPYFPDANAAVQAALLAARLVLVTHEHGDHVAGVVRSPNREAIAAHTLLTRAQVETLVLAPQSPEIRLGVDEAADYVVIDYALLLPVAPGVVLLKAPGHTPGHQMVYVRLDSGTEYLLSGDVTWALDGIVDRTQRPAATSERIREDRDALALQIDWLAQLAADGDVVVVPSHDAGLLADLERRGLIREGLVAD